MAYEIQYLFITFIYINEERNESGFIEARVNNMRRILTKDIE